MRPTKYPYSGTNKKKPTKEEKLELVVFPNVAFRKDLLKHVFSVVKQHDNATIIYFRIPKVFGYEEERAKVHLSYEKTMRILNSY
ncbi:TPA: hypothetical protein IV024_002992 [Enterococcus faecium]|nr:hypothetical protein [Enterococcus faecium]